MSLQALIHLRERNIAEKDRRIADIEMQSFNIIADAKITIVDTCVINTCHVCCRELDKELMSLQALIHVRERNIAEKDRRIADIEKQIFNEIEDAKAAKRREQAENASPRYH